MGGGGQQPTQTTRAELGPEQRQIFEMAMPGLREFAASVPQRYQGSQVAGFTPEQIAGQGMALDAAERQDQMAGLGSRTSDFFLGGDIWNPESNPNLRGAIDATTRPIYENLTEKALPAIRGEATNTGNFGSSRQAIAESGAIRDTGRVAGDAASKLVQSQYDTNVRAQLQSLGLLPQTQGAQVMPATTTSGVGDVQQSQNQALLNADINAFNWDQYAPYMQARDLISLVQGMPGGSTTSTGSVTQPNPWMQGLGGAAAGATLGSAIMPGVGTAAGAGLGALLPFVFR